MARSSVSSIDRFDKEYPAQLPARLKWLEDRLGVGKEPMLLLRGLPRVKVASVRTRRWQDIVKKYEPEADQVEHLLTRYLGYFDFDSGKARDFAKNLDAKVTAGKYNLS